MSRCTHLCLLLLTLFPGTPVSCCSWAPSSLCPFSQEHSRGHCGCYCLQPILLWGRTASGCMFIWSLRFKNVTFFFKVTYSDISKFKKYEEVYSEKSSHPFRPMFSVIPITLFKWVHAGYMGVKNSVGRPGAHSEGPGSNSWPAGFPADKPRPGDVQDPAGGGEASGPFRSHSYCWGSSPGGMGVATP